MAKPQIRDVTESKGELLMYIKRFVISVLSFCLLERNRCVNSTNSNCEMIIQTESHCQSQLRLPTLLASGH